MAEIARHSLKKLARLVGDVFTLYQLIRQNRFDDTLSKQGYLINYLIDPDLLELWAHPDVWTAEVAALPSLHDDEDDDRTWIDSIASEDGIDELRPLSRSTDPLLEATALLTGENIFSQNFVGVGNSLYVSPEHMPEFVFHALKIERRYRSALRTSSRDAEHIYTNLRHDLNVAARVHEEKKTDVLEWMKSVRDILVNGLSGVSHSALLADHRLKLLQQRGILANADSNAAFTHDVVSPPIKLVDWFAERIRHTKEEHHPARPSSEAIERDAITLTQLTMLNRDWDRDKKVFTLITRDRSLYVAYHDWIEKQPPVQQEIFFPLRHPRQYVPILNLSEMSGEIKDATIFPILETACKDIVDLFSDEQDISAQPTLGLRPRNLSALRSKIIANDHRISKASETLGAEIENIASVWVAMLKSSIADKADIIHELFEAENIYWKKFIEGRQLKRPLASESSDFARRFERLATSSSLLRHEVLALETASGRAGAGSAVDDFGHREIVSEYDALLSSPFKGVNVLQLIFDLPNKPAGGVKEFERAEYRCERLFVAGILSLEVGAWSGAASLFERSSSALRSEPYIEDKRHAFANEIAFLLALSYRLSGQQKNWTGKYDRAQRILDDLIARKLSDLDVMRALSESLALDLCSLAWSFDRAGISNELASGDAERAMAHLLEFDRLFGIQFLLDATATAQPIDRIHRQVALNIVDLYFWWNVLGLSSVEFLTSGARASIKWLDSNTVSGAPNSRIYPALAEIWLSDSQNFKMESAVWLSKYIHDLLARNADRGYAFKLPSVDVLEYGKILHVLRTFLE